MSKKIVLIQPPSPFLMIEKWDLPISSLYLKGFLEKEGHQIEFINLAGIKNYLAAIPLDAGIYGISMFTPHHNLGIEIGKYLKENTNALIVGGGHHVSAIPQNFLENSEFDIVVRGEGELTFTDICNEKIPQEIKGISYKLNGKIIHNPDRDFIKNIDIIPFPKLDNINLEEYEKKIYRMDLMTSRGCPKVCAFCSSSNFWKKKVRFHSEEYVIENIDYLSKKNINDFHFVDDNFILKHSRLEKICDKLESVGSKWACTIRADSVNPEIANLMKKTGCQKVSLGIETGSERLLEHINKKETVEDYKKAIYILKKAGLTTLGFLMVGLPTENKKDIDATVRFIKEQPLDRYTISTFVPYPGTPIWHNPENFGYKFRKNISYDKYCSMGKEIEVESISEDYKQTNKHRKMLINALGNKCTNLKSFKITNAQKITK